MGFRLPYIAACAILLTVISIAMTIEGASLWAHRIVSVVFGFVAAFGLRCCERWARLEGE